MKHKLLTLFLALVASVGTLFAQSGTCGTNLKWTLSSGTLTISGNGAMMDYTSNSRRIGHFAGWGMLSAPINTGVSEVSNISDTKFAVENAL